MNIGFIVKVSKLCNLRCVYCCEMDQLGDPTKMSIDEIRVLFRTGRNLLANMPSGVGGHGLTFYWHGGEPFAQPVRYWEGILRVQDEVLGGLDWLQTTNAVQSNLTLVRDAHLHLFDRMRLGFSYDVVNDLRVTRLGEPSGEMVLTKIDWLAEHGVSLAGTVVVSRANYRHAPEVVEFFLARDMAFRFIHLDEGLEHLDATNQVRVDFDTFLGFAREVYRLASARRAMAEGIRIDPLTTVLQARERARSGFESSLSIDECAQREHLLEVDTDGEVRSTADYPYRLSYGNIFEQPLEVILTSEPRQRRIERSRERIETVCTDCPFFRRGCNGGPVSHATEPVFQEYMRAGGCEIRCIGDMVEREDVLSAGASL